MSELLKDYIEENEDESFHSPVGKIRENFPFNALAAADPTTSMESTRMIRSKSNVHDCRESAKM